MKTQKRSIEKIVEQQVQRWRIMPFKEGQRKAVLPVITISREPGSNGGRVAKGVAKKLNFDLFHQEILHGMAESARISEQLLRTLDEKGLSILEDWITSLVNERHLWPDQYLQHLMKVIGTIGKHGNAIIIGRGANFILPIEKRIRVRIISPNEVRVDNIAEQYHISKEKARHRMIRTESNRRAFIRKYFNADIDNPINYDIVINTSILNDNTTIAIIAKAVNNMKI